jgi:hypothetical protein
VPPARAVAAWPIRQFRRRRAPSPPPLARPAAPPAPRPPRLPPETTPGSAARGLPARHVLARALRERHRRRRRVTTAPVRRPARASRTRRRGVADPAVLPPPRPVAPAPLPARRAARAPPATPASRNDPRFGRPRPARGIVECPRRTRPRLTLPRWHLRAVEAGTRHAERGARGDDADERDEVRDAGHHRLLPVSARARSSSLGAVRLTPSSSESFFWTSMMAAAFLSSVSSWETRRSSRSTSSACALRIGLRPPLAGRQPGQLASLTLLAPFKQARRVEALPPQQLTDGPIHSRRKGGIGLAQDALLELRGERPPLGAIGCRRCQRRAGARGLPHSGGAACPWRSRTVLL